MPRPLFVYVEPEGMPAPGVEDCDARQLINRLRVVSGAGSLYAVAKLLGVPSSYPQTWYRKNRVTAPLRKLLVLMIAQYSDT